MKISLAALSKRQDDVLEALKRNRKISISHNGQVVAVLQSPRAAGESENLFHTPAFGMWADRDDMADPNEWRHGLRRSRREDLARRIDGDGE